MLTKGDRNNILQLRSQDFSYNAIHNELGFSKDTIMKVCKSDEVRKIKEVEESQTNGVERSNNVSIIDKMQELARIADNRIEQDKLNDKEDRVWEKREVQFRKMLREEVYDKIPEIRADAVKKRDREWQDFNKKRYAKKEVVTDLKNLINKKENVIQDLKNKLNEKEDLENQNWNLSRENNGLKAEKKDLWNYIENFLDDAGRWEHKILTHNRDFFNAEKSEFYKDKQIQQLYNTKMINDGNEKYNAAKKLEEEAADLIKNCRRMVLENDDKLDKTEKTNIDDKQKIRKELADIIKIYKYLMILWQQLQEWNKLLDETEGFNKFSLFCPHCCKPMFFDAADPETYQNLINIFGDTHPECLKENKQKFVTLHPVLLSGETVLQSGFSSVIQSSKVIVSV